MPQQSRLVVVPSIPTGHLRQIVVVLQSWKPHSTLDVLHTIPLDSINYIVGPVVSPCNLFDRVEFNRRICVKRRIACPLSHLIHPTRVNYRNWILVPDLPYQYLDTTIA